jgi:hypothetical protein
VTFLPKWTEQQEAGGAVNVEPPSDSLVKPLRAVDIRNGDDDDLELHVNSRDVRVSCCVATTDFMGAHGYLLCSVGGSPSRFCPRRYEADHLFRLRQISDFDEIYSLNKCDAWVTVAFARIAAATMAASVSIVSFAPALRASFVCISMQ